MRNQVGKNREDQEARAEGSTEEDPLRGGKREEDGKEEAEAK